MGFLRVTMFRSPLAEICSGHHNLHQNLSKKHVSETRTSPVFIFVATFVMIPNHNFSHIPRKKHPQAPAAFLGSMEYTTLVTACNGHGDLMNMGAIMGISNQNINIPTLLAPEIWLIKQDYCTNHEMGYTHVR